MVETLVQILNSLNAVEVRGESNLSHQLGAIQALKQLIVEQGQKTVKAEKKEENPNGQQRKN